jgi:hypothetical protein
VAYADASRVEGMVAVSDEVDLLRVGVPCRWSRRARQEDADGQILKRPDLQGDRVTQHLGPRRDQHRGPSVERQRDIRARGLSPARGSTAELDPYETGPVERGCSPACSLATPMAARPM